MKTFSQFESKKQNIIEKELFSDRNRSDINNILNKYFGSEKKSKKTAKDLLQGSGQGINSGTTKYSKNKELDKQISQTRSRETTRGDAFRRSLSDFDDSDAGRPTTGNTVDKPTTNNTVKSQTQRMSDALDKPEVKSAIKNKRGLPTQNRLTKRGTRSYTPPSKTLSQNIQTKSIINQANKVKDNLRTVDKKINPNVARGSGDGITASKGGGATVKPSQPSARTIYDINRKKLQSLKNIKPITPKRGVIDKLVFGDIDTPKPQTTISKDMLVL